MSNDTKIAKTQGKLSRLKVQLARNIETALARTSEQRSFDPPEIGTPEELEGERALFQNSPARNRTNSTSSETSESPIEKVSAVRASFSDKPRNSLFSLLSTIFSRLRKWVARFFQPNAKSTVLVERHLTGGRTLSASGSTTGPVQYTLVLGKLASPANTQLVRGPKSKSSTGPTLRRLAR